MFGIEALDVVIGLIFIYLLFSLFVSIVNEIIGNLFNSRGNQLFESIKELIGEEGIREMMKDHRIQALAKTGKNLEYATSELSELKKAWPEYIPESLFADIIAKADNGHVQGLLKELEHDVKNSTTKMKEAYETALVKTRQTYVTHTRKLTLLISIIIVVTFNVDSISIFHELANDPSKAAIVVSMTEQYIAANDSLDLGAEETTIKELKDDLASLQSEQLQHLESTLGLGWTAGKFWTEIKWHSLPGWFITVLALSLGAPFWFDTLKKVVNIKNEIKQTSSGSNSSSTINE